MITIYHSLIFLLLITPNTLSYKSDSNENGLKLGHQKKDRPNKSEPNRPLSKDPKQPFEEVQGSINVKQMQPTASNKLKYGQQMKPDDYLHNDGIYLLNSKYKGLIITKNNPFNPVKTDQYKQLAKPAGVVQQIITYSVKVNSNGQLSYHQGGEDIQQNILNNLDFKHPYCQYDLKLESDGSLLLICSRTSPKLFKIQLTVSYDPSRSISQSTVSSIIKPFTNNDIEFEYNSVIAENQQCLIIYDENCRIYVYDNSESDNSGDLIYWFGDSCNDQDEFQYKKLCFEDDGRVVSKYKLGTNGSEKSIQIHKHQQSLVNKKVIYYLSHDCQIASEIQNENQSIKYLSSAIAWYIYQITRLNKNSHFFYRGGQWYMTYEMLRSQNGRYWAFIDKYFELFIINTSDGNSNDMEIAEDFSNFRYSSSPQSYHSAQNIIVFSFQISNKQGKVNLEVVFKYIRFENNQNLEEVEDVIKLDEYYKYLQGDKSVQDIVDGHSTDILMNVNYKTQFDVDKQIDKDSQFIVKLDDNGGLIFVDSNDKVANIHSSSI